MPSQRRRFLKGVAVSSVPLLAGCTGNGGDDGGDGGDGGGDSGGGFGDDGGDVDYPTEDIRWIIGASAGGGFDRTVRGLLEFVPDFLPDDIENIPDNVSPPREGYLEIYRAEPDGYTVGSFPFEGEVGAHATGDDIPDPAELTPIARLITTEYVIIAGADSGIGSVADLEGATDINWATPGEGTTAWQSSIISAGLFDTEVSYVNFEGMAEAVTAVVRGDAEVVLGPVTSPPIVEAMDAGDAVPLVVFSEEVPDQAEGAQTPAEAGYEQLLSLNLNRSIFGPPEIPDERVQILTDAIRQAIETDEMQEWAESNDEELNYGGPEELSEVVQGASETAQQFSDQLSQA